MADWNEVKADLARLRDEARLQLHLGGKEAQDEWERLEAKWHTFAQEAHLAESAEGLKAALNEVAEELKLAYDQIRNAV